MNDLNNINTAIASLNSNDLLRVILYGDESFNKETNCKILTASIKFIKDTKHFKSGHWEKKSFKYFEHFPSKTVHKKEQHNQVMK